MNQVALRDTENELHMHVPYALNRSFREVFKTATWDSTRKVFIAKSTTQNKNKWEKFKACTSEAQQVLADTDNLEATAAELEQLAESAEQALNSLNLLINETHEKIQEARKREQLAREQIEKLAPALELAEAEYKTALERLKVEENARNEVIAPAIKLYQKLDVNKLLNYFAAEAGNIYPNKQRLSQTQSELRKIYEELNGLGYEHNGLYLLLRTSLNQPSKIRDAVHTVRSTLEIGLSVKGQ